MNETLNTINGIDFILFFLLFTACFFLNEYRMKVNRLSKKLYWLTNKKEEIEEEITRNSLEYEIEEIEKPQIVKDVISGKFNKKTNLKEYYKGRK
jgi:hypothetical protein